MGLLLDLLTFPVSAPLKGALWIAEQITEQVEDELYNEERIRAQLIELELRFDLGEISESTYSEAEAALLERLRVARTRRAAE